MKKIIAMLLTAVVLTGYSGMTVNAEEAVAASIAYEQQGMNEIVYSNTLTNIKNGPGNEFETVGIARVDEIFTRVATLTNGWSEVIYNGEICYIYSRNLSQYLGVEEIMPVEPVVPQEGTKTMFGMTYYQSGTTPNGVMIWDTSVPYGWKDYIINAIDAAGITNEMTEYEKCVAINNYICSVVEYGETTIGAEWFTSESSDYCLVLGRGICLGYADAFQSMCCALGMECTIEGGGTPYGGHAWNAVIADGILYYADSTWNDVTNNLYLMSTSLWEDHWR